MIYRVSNLAGGLNPSEKYESQLGLYTLPKKWKVIKFHGSSHHQPETLSTFILVVYRIRHHLQLVAETPSRQTEGTVRDAVGRVQKQPHGWSHSEKDLPLGWAVVGEWFKFQQGKSGFNYHQS